MRKGLFIFGVALLASIRTAPTMFETVWLKDVTTRFSSDKRTFSDLDHPDELTLNLRRGSGDITINLKRNYDIDPNADIYFARISKDGQSFLVKTPNFGKEGLAYYQDMDNGAFMTVRCVKISNEQCDRDIYGNIQIGDSSYDLRPAETKVTSRNLFEVPGLFGKRYVLQNQAYIQRENSVEHKDAGKVTDRKVEQELTALVRRFEGQNKHTHVSRSNATLSSQNVLAFHNRAATERARQLKKDYYVKVAVLIDSRTWDLYESMVSSVSPLIRNRETKRKIRESYSHIMNGVNLRYKGIQDSTISISVILSRFIYFKWNSHFQHVFSTVVGQNYIKQKDYLKDLSYWDQDIGKTYAPSYDHAMLFTRYILYADSPDVPSLGISYDESICDVGGRISIVFASDYFLTTMTAAHELGHNLGASHDGEGNATACKAEDLFLMTSEEPEVHPARPLSRNLWIFSNCSVEAFKKNLKDKDCVRYADPLYDEQEYQAYVMKQPGEVYTPNDQCHVINGPGSVYCGTVPVNSCYLRCTDPSTVICKNKYYGAARGTQCGQNMWCIEARCVPKLRTRSKPKRLTPIHA